MAVLVSVAAALVTGCSDTVDGTPVAAGAAGSPRHVEADLSALLIDPAQFPKPYQALVLPAQAVSQAASDLGGIPAGAKVDPAGCVPEQRDDAGEAAIAVGTDAQSRATISVALVRSTTSLDSQRSKFEQCKDVTATIDGATSTVHTELAPAPPIDADDTLATEQTVSSGSGGTTLKQSMLTLVAQVGDVRISATFMSFHDAKVDSAALDSVFTDAVAKVKRAA